jgi:myo-inositol-1(or 4)-monophosphatase
MSAIRSPHMNTMIKASEKAARSLIRDFGEVEQLQISQKGPGDFVSAADKRAEEIIYEVLSEAYPKFGFLMEESGKRGDADSDYRWIVDPLDGTTNFLHGIPHWCISIALEHKGEIVCGLIHDPVKNEMFTAEKNAGAFLQRKRLRVSGRRDPRLSCVLTGAPHRAKNNHEQFFREYEAAWGMGVSLRRYGAAALDMAYVAAGRAEAFWERGLREWDIAAGYLIVKEAGGFVGDLNAPHKSPLSSGDVIAANESLFTDLQKVLKAA